MDNNLRIFIYYFILNFYSLTKYGEDIYTCLEKE